jgi:predicted permease
VSGNYFRTVGVNAALGRTIQPGEDTPEQWTPVAMIGHRFWQRVFGGDPAVTSRTLKLNGRTFAIVGVVPESFTGLDPATPADVLLPIGAASISAQTVNPLQNRGIWSICRVVGRLRAGASEGQAQAEIEHALSAAIAAHPPAEPYDSPRVHLADGSAGLGTLRDAATAPLGILLAAVGTLLVAACANIAGLLLARGGVRQREIATRLAVGAPRARLVRQLVTESLVLSAVGGVLGVGLAYGLSGTTQAVISQFMPTLFGADRQLDLVTTPDLRVLGFALAATLGAGLLFGLAPAIRATRVDLIGAIRQVKSDAGGGRRWADGRLLVALQVALGVVLLVSTGMFLRTVANLRAADLGFPTERLLYARVEPRSGNLPQNQRLHFFQSAMDRIEQLPGVTAASAAITVPYGGDTNVGSRPALSVCQPGTAGRGPVSVPVEVNFVAPGYFKTLGVEILAGRDLA